MARGELMKKLLASYGRDDEFRAVAEQIIDEEEKKNDRVLARSLRKTLEAAEPGRQRQRPWRRSFHSQTPPRILSSASSPDIPETRSSSAPRTCVSC